MLYIIQMSDFHFGAPEPSYEHAEDILSKMRDKILNVVPEGSGIALCLCGDYIDSREIKVGDKMRQLTEDEAQQRYQKAGEILERTIITPLNDKYRDLIIGLCPGNHDITHVSAMNGFSRQFINKDIDKIYKKHIDPDNVDLIFVNSCSANDHSYGEIDYDQLNTVLMGCNRNSAKYVFLHHTIMSMYQDDTSSIRETPKLVRLVDQYSIKAIFHGHTHGQYVVRIGNTSCPIVGVGAVLARNNPDVNSQFNLICCNEGMPLFADSYLYHADAAMIEGNDGFTINAIPILMDSNCFHGNNFSDVYEELSKKVTAEKVLYHVNLHVNSKFSDFAQDINDNFGIKKEFGTLDKEFSYAELAEKWEAPKPDKETLYFNHGEYFSTKEYPDGIDYVIAELTKKETSSRAVLATVNTQKISSTAPDDLLPSLMAIQFSFDSPRTTLYVALNLRALEVSRFLKINICEVLYLSQKIHNAIQFNNIDVTISAFRVQKKKNFGCFLRAKLDSQAQKDELTFLLSSLYYGKEITTNLQRLVRLLEDKQERSETVIETVGICNLKDSLATIIGKLPDENVELKQKLDELYETTNHLLDLLNDLKEDRKHNSVPTEEMQNLENEIQSQYSKLISGFEDLIADDTEGTD